jgi:O-antigen/teichoic acid export membrane protein
MAATLLLSGAIALILVYFGHAKLIIWVGVESGTAAAYILPWLIAAYFILALNVVPYYLLLGMGRIRYVGMVVLAAGATSILTICITITDLGVLGAAAGRGAYGLFSLALAFPVLQYIRKNCSVMRKKMLPNVEEIM